MRQNKLPTPRSASVRGRMDGGRAAQLDKIYEEKYHHQLAGGYTVALDSRLPSPAAVMTQQNAPTRQQNQKTLFFKSLILKLIKGDGEISWLASDDMLILQQARKSYDFKAILAQCNFQRLAATFSQQEWETVRMNALAKLNSLIEPSEKMNSGQFKQCLEKYRPSHLTGAEVLAINLYTQSTGQGPNSQSLYAELNQILRGQYQCLSRITQSSVLNRHMSKLLFVLAFAVTGVSKISSHSRINFTYRSTSDFPKRDEFEHRLGLSNSVCGLITPNPAFTSTSTRDTSFDPHAPMAHMFVKMPGAEIKDFSRFKSENEWLVIPNTYTQPMFAEERIDERRGKYFAVIERAVDFEDGALTPRTLAECYQPPTAFHEEPRFTFFRGNPPPSSSPDNILSAGRQHRFRDNVLGLILRIRHANEQPNQLESRFYNEITHGCAQLSPDQIKAYIITALHDPRYAELSLDYRIHLAIILEDKYLLAQGLNQIFCHGLGDRSRTLYIMNSFIQKATTLQPNTQFIGRALELYKQLFIDNLETIDKNFAEITTFGTSMVSKIISHLHEMAQLNRYQPGRATVSIAKWDDKSCIGTCGLKLGLNNEIKEMFQQNPTQNKCLAYINGAPHVSFEAALDELEHKRANFMHAVKVTANKSAEKQNQRFGLLSRYVAGGSGSNEPFASSGSDNTHLLGLLRGLFKAYIERVAKNKS